MSEHPPLPPGTARPVTVRGNPVLHRVCEPVTSFHTDIPQLVADLFASMAAADGVGLAANQIGANVRIFVWDCPDGTGVHQVGHVINPELTIHPEPDTPPEDDDENEGCLSVPGLYEDLPRPALASISGTDVWGEPVQVHGTGMLARCLQHEYDHLDGILYIDKLPEDLRKDVIAQLKKRIRNGDVPRWSEAWSPRTIRSIRRSGKGNPKILD